MTRGFADGQTRPGRTGTDGRLPDTEHNPPPGADNAVHDDADETTRAVLMSAGRVRWRSAISWCAWPNPRDCCCHRAVCSGIRLSDVTSLSMALSSRDQPGRKPLRSARWLGRLSPELRRRRVYREGIEHGRFRT
jgi:hypothetical protein